MPAVLHRVVDQVAQALLDRKRPADERPRSALDFDKSTAFEVVVLQALDERDDIDRLCPFAGIRAFREFERPAHHFFHFLQVANKLFAQLLVGKQLAAQPQPGDRRLQVVRDGGQQPCPIAQMVRDTRLHPVERARRVTHFRRA